MATGDKFSESRLIQRGTTVLLLLAAAASCAAGVRYGFLGSTESSGGWVGPLYLLLAGVLVILPRVAKAKLTKDGLEFERFEERAAGQLDQTAASLKALQQRLSILEEAERGRNATPIPAGAKAVEKDASDLLPKAYVDELRRRHVRIGPDPDDPLKLGVMTNSANGFTLSATVVTDATQPNWFEIQFELKKPADSNAKSADLILHPTFSPFVQPFGFEGRIARTQVWAWGAFTIAVVVDDGTELRLDLGGLLTAPAAFRLR
ncbi:MAG: hypothetical protein QM770_03525 [Tepidisphaeraceae bacterium]